MFGLNGFSGDFVANIGLDFDEILLISLQTTFIVQKTSSKSSFHPLL